MTAPAPTSWVLVHPAEVGLLHRLRAAVRATARGTLVQLDREPPVPGAQLGVAVTGRLVWFGPGLTAAQTGVVVDAVHRDDVAHLPATLAAVVAGTTPAAPALSPGSGASPRT